MLLKRNMYKQKYLVGVDTLVMRPWLTPGSPWLTPGSPLRSAAWLPMEEGTLRTSPTCPARHSQHQSSCHESGGSAQCMKEQPKKPGIVAFSNFAEVFKFSRSFFGSPWELASFSKNAEYQWLVMRIKFKGVIAWTFCFDISQDFDI